MVFTVGGRPFLEYRLTVLQNEIVRISISAKAFRKLSIALILSCFQNLRGIFDS